MAISIQFHKYEGIPKHDHNVRNINEEHIRGEKEGGFFKVIKDTDWKNQVDNVIFKEDIERFNERQTRKDRLKISYYDECKDRELKDEERKILKKSQGQKDYNVFRPVHEFVLGFYGDDIDVKEKQKLIEEYVKNFEERYSDNLVIVGAYIHGDEQKGLIEKGIKNLDNIDLHLHLDVVPIAHGYKLGMENQISLSGALKELGFENTNRKENSLVNFESRQREELKRILNKDRQIPIEIIPTSTEKKEHLEKEAFVQKEIIKSLSKEKTKKQREVLRIENEIENTKTELNYYYNEINKSKEVLDNIDNDLDSKKIEFAQTVTAVNELEEKGDKIVEKHNQLKEEIDILKDEKSNVKNDLENSISDIINNNVVSNELAKELINNIETALTNAYDRGYKAKEYDKNKETDRAYVIDKEIKGLFRENSPLNKLNNTFNTINKNIRELAKEYTNNTHIKIKEKLQKKREQKQQQKEVDKILNNIDYEDYFEIFFNKDGNVTEKSEKFLEQKIIGIINGKTDDENWRQLQDRYFNLDSDNRQELLQYIKKDCLKYLIDYNTPKIEDIKFKKFLYSNGIKYSKFGGDLLSSYMQLQQQIIEEYEDD